MANSLHPAEEFARRAIAGELQLPVEQHDDGSEDAMFDLSFQLPDRIAAAVEVTAAVDGPSVELWKLINPPDEQWIEPSLAGGWIIALKPTARAKTIRKELANFLVLLEETGVREIRPRGFKRLATPNEQAAARLGITQASQSPTTSVPGSIYFTVERASELTGGTIPTTADPIVPWVASFLQHPDRADVVRKLDRSGRGERHAFVILPGFTEAPFGVVASLFERDIELPVADLELPSAITHVWLASTWSTSRGLRWSPDQRWSWFTTHGH